MHHFVPTGSLRKAWLAYTRYFHHPDTLLANLSAYELSTKDEVLVSEMFEVLFGIFLVTLEVGKISSHLAL